ncbi:MAG: alpha/beta hydrolase [Phyllobacterium sp.]|uniref:alpha/beta hydrolase n=1 Tax=Phyllobacterium sp. TaxID=1871046 RepID=UPI0030F10E25
MGHDCFAPASVLARHYYAFRVRARAVLGLDPSNVVKANATVPAPATNDKTGPKAVVPIFVATGRQRADDLSLPYSSKRSPTLNFARVDIGIPPTHKNGEVEKSSHKPNSAHHFATTTFQPYDNGQIFIDKINAELAKRPADKREVFIIVHGCNNNFADSVFRQAQIAYDYDLPAVAVHYSWPTRGLATAPAFPCCRN